jgi:MYXO-CTERM domain-containing protein
MSQTLEAAAALTEMTSTDAPRYVILLTDGWQWCSPYDPATRTAPVAPVDTLTANGVTVFVVGFGDSVDVSTLNQMAVHAGTALVGCDPTGDEVTDPNPCYYRADDPVTLVAALDAIALHVAAETCDGLDNNCDGLIDEGLSRGCDSACGSGTETCSAGEWVGCDAPQPARETCDAIDNDCDGIVDNSTIILCPTGFACTDGAYVAVTPIDPPGGEVTGEAVGCGCRTGAGASPLAGLLALLGLALLRRRR